MSSPQGGDDEWLLAALAQALDATRSATPWVRGLGEEIYAWHGVDAELAQARLVYDSVLDGTATRETEYALRGAGGAISRTVVFEGGTGSVELECSGGQLIGQVIPPEPGEIAVVTATGQVTLAEVDEVGCFCVESIPAEVIQFRWRTPATNLVTEWVRL